VATAGGVGYTPIAPGTVGSALALLILWLVPLSAAGRAAFLVAVTVAGILASGRVERVVGRKDPGIIVIDEVAGMTLAVVNLPLTPAVAAAGFVLFRVFDVLKPFPAGWSQSLPGGIGVMTDDLIAGAYALVLVAAARAWLVTAP
jgi:phosphatidylglycerophosphatase A